MSDSTSAKSSGARRLNPAQLIDSAQLVDLLFSRSQDGVFIMMLPEPVRWDDSVDKDAVLDHIFDHKRVVMVNDAMLDHYGSTREELLGTTGREFFAHDPKYGKRTWRTFFDAGRIHTETEERRKDGTPVWIEGDYICMYDDRGYLAGHFGIQRDVTERHLTREQLRYEQSFLEAALDAQQDLFFVFEPLSGKPVRWNRALVEQTGFAVEEIAARKVPDDWIRPEDLPRAADLIRDILLGRIDQGDVTLELIVKGGRCITMEFSGSIFRMPGDRDPLIIVTGRDISQRLQTLEALRESEERFRRLSNASSEGVGITHGGVVIDVNQAILEMYRCKYEDFVGRSPMDFVAPESRELVMNNIREGVEEPYEQIGLRPDGSRFPIETTGRSIFFDGVEYRVTTIRDLTQKKEAERQLRERDEMIRGIVETSRDWIWAIDIEGRMTYSNPVIEEVLGYKPEERIGRSDLEIMHPDDAARTREMLPIWIAEKRGWRDYPVRWITSGGELRYTESSSVPIFDAQGSVTGFRGVDRDITERRRIEEELLKTQKLESLGILAGGIAHDFNNILTSLLSNIQLSRMMATRGRDFDSMLAECETAVMRAGDLTKQLLTFARGGAPVKSLVHLDPLIRAWTRFALRGTNVEGEVDVERGLWPLEIDEGQINQVVNNLLINACQAMPGGGTVAVEVRNRTLEAGGVDPSLDLAPGRYVLLRFIDRGTGIPENLLPKIFDPYFSTKQTGSGLGLATSFSIVRSHGGTIRVESRIGEGSCFEILLPASAGTAAARQTHDMQVVRGEGRVLLMDDDLQVRQIGRRMLEELGYRAEVAAHGDEAIEVYRAARQAGDPFGAVILDLTVPGGRGGAATLEELRRIDPGVRAVVTSGYSQDPVLAQFADYGFCGILPKPFDLAHFSRVLRDALQTESTG